MSPVLMIDASVWVDLFRDGSGNRRARLQSVIGDQDLVLSRLTEMELLQGTRDEREWGLLSSYLSSQEYVEPSVSTWRDSARIFFDLRRLGHTIRSPLDCCIAQSALEAEALLLHRDRDFESIAKIRPLQQMFLDWES